MENRHARIATILVLIALLLSGGTIGYMLIMDMSLLDALYMTLITISTVGFQEVTELSVAGRIFTMGLILAGLTTVAYAFTSITAFLVEGEVQKLWRRWRMDGRLGVLENHMVVCGAGKTGHIVIEELQRMNVPFVVIEKDSQTIEGLRQHSVLVVEGDASEEEQLEQARIHNSRGLIACLGTDADNVFTVLTARGMNPDLYIVARAYDRHAHGKLRKAGADNTVSPNELGGTRMAALVLRPAVVSFIDVITRVGDVGMDLEEVNIRPGSEMVGRTLKEARIRERTGLVVLAVKKAETGKTIFNPGLEEPLQTDDSMIVLGEIGRINTLRSLACDTDEDKQTQ